MHGDMVKKNQSFLYHLLVPEKLTAQALLSLNLYQITHIELYIPYYFHPCLDRASSDLACQNCLSQTMSRF